MVWCDDDASEGRLGRRTFIFGVAGASLSTSAALAAAPALEMFKTPGCQCCTAWARHLQQAGFAVEVIETADLSAVRRRLGAPDALASCHIASVGGYFVEGHVPVADIRRLLRERPKAKGIAVPGMPIGSPGMENPGVKAQPFETILVTAQGTRVFARHG